MADEINTYLEKSVNVAKQMMGSFLPRVLHLENLMTNIMTQHFCSHDEGRAVLFLSSITPDMGFRNKINIFLNMIRIYYDEIFKAYEPDLRRLYEIGQYRTDLEHLVASQSGKVANTGTADEKTHETKVRLCIKLAATLNTIQRTTVLSGMS